MEKGVGTRTSMNVMTLKRGKVAEVVFRVHFPKVKVVLKLVCDVFSANSRSSEGTIRTEENK